LVRAFHLLSYFWPEVTLNGNYTQFKTRLEFAQELNFSFSTFKRKLKEKGYKLPKGLLSPKTQKTLRRILGCVKIESNSSNEIDNIDL
jgi:hypothetical protein